MTVSVRSLPNFAAGAWIESGAAELLEDRDPADGSLLARVPLSGAEDVDLAVAGAREAQRRWRATPVLKRAAAVRALGGVLAEHREELAELVTRDLGKTPRDALAEVERGLESVEAASAVAAMTKGEVLEGVARGVDVEMVRQPVGVVAAVTPFNFPAMIPLWFLPYAVATGNGFVLKPSERDPLPSTRIVELVAAVEEIPTGLVGLVHGGHEAVDGLLDHPGVDAVSFVGQASTARYVAMRAMERGKRVQALGGAKNASVLMPDADPEQSVAAILSSAFGSAGQRCLAGSVLVLAGRPTEREEALERIVEAASRLRVGPGADPGVDVCPMISPAARQGVERHIERAAEAGAEILLDGRVPGGGPAGTLLGPTIIAPSDDEDPVLRTELFGPVLSVVRVADLGAALEFLNRSRYGNAAMIFTSSGAAARDFRRGVEAGMIGVNIGVAAPVAWFPFAGWKDSFDGDLHANGADAFHFYTRKKVVTSRWP